MLLSYHKSGVVEAGCDEAGRGCLAGPVVAAAVIVPHDYQHHLLNDSKVINKKNRLILREEIKKEAICWGVGQYSNEEIDQVNILNASFYAMHRAVDQLDQIPDHLIIDGNRFHQYKDISHDCIIKGDGKYLSIAAASILAKTFRDDLMEELALKYPGYGWEQNAGYPTKAHRAAIREFGITPYHRKSFRLLPEQLNLF
jgi:ribonuclease HII